MAKSSDEKTSFLPPPSPPSAQLTPPSSSVTTLSPPSPLSSSQPSNSSLPLSSSSPSSLPSLLEDLVPSKAPLHSPSPPPSSPLSPYKSVSPSIASLTSTDKNIAISSPSAVDRSDSATPTRKDREKAKERESADSLWLIEKKRAEEAQARIEQENLAKFKKMMERKLKEEEEDRAWAKELEEKRKREEERAIEKEERERQERQAAEEEERRRKKRKEEKRAHAIGSLVPSNAESEAERLFREEMEKMDADADPPPLSTLASSEVTFDDPNEMFKAEMYRLQQSGQEASAARPKKRRSDHESSIESLWKEERERAKERVKRANEQILKDLPKLHLQITLLHRGHVPIGVNMPGCAH